MSTISAIAKIKLLAIIVGPLGIGVISQLNSLTSIIFSIIPIGALGLTKFIAEYYHDKKFSELSTLIIYFFLRNIPWAIGIFFLMLIIPDILSKLLFNDFSFSTVIIWFSISIPFGLIMSFIDIYYKGIREINVYIKYIISSSIVTLFLYIPLIYFFKIDGAIAGVVLSTLVNIVIGYFFLKKNRLLPSLKIKARQIQIDKNVRRNIIQIGIAAMFMLTLQQISLLFIKSYIVDNVGLYSVGIFQSVLSISNNYLALFFSVIATYSLPKLSTLDNNKDKIIEINHILKLVILIYTPLIVLLYIFRVYFILILYSEDFLPNNQLLFYQLSGDYFRALSWIFGLWLLPNLKIKQWLIFDLFNSVCITIVSVILFRIYNSIEVFSLAYLITHFIQVIIQFFYIRFSLGFNFLFNNLNVLSISLTYLIVIFIISRMDVVLGYLIVLPSTLLWLVFVVRKTELESIKLLFVSYIRRN